MQPITFKSDRLPGITEKPRTAVTLPQTIFPDCAGTKDIVIKALPNGGVEEASIGDPEKISGFCLDAAHLDALVRLGLLCEQHFGPGRDIEWGIEKDILYLLQCRSITTGLGN